KSTRVNLRHISDGWGGQIHVIFRQYRTNSDWNLAGLVLRSRIQDIERNIFKNTGGVSVGTSSVFVYITNNIFTGSTNGYAIENWASYGGENIFVSKNSFLDVGKVALMLPGGYNSSAITATNNYWGTTTQSAIQSMIYDKTNDLSSAGYISFLPFLTQPDAATPIYP
ncbi:MAG TPA: hypothetical protein VIM63_18235, partial [Rhodoferax sp.]